MLEKISLGRAEGTGSCPDGDTGHGQEQGHVMTATGEKEMGW